MYRARLGPKGFFSREVAVKTLKGCTFCYKFPNLPLFSGDFDQLEVNKFVEESLKMSRFKHRHIMGLVGVCLDAGPAPYIIMPYMENRCLLDYLKRERDSLVIKENADDDQV